MTDLNRIRDAYPPLADAAPPAATIARLQALYDVPAAATKGAARRRRRPSRRIGLLAIGGILVAGSAVAATGAWHPILGSDLRPRPSAANTGVPADQLAALAILRRAQTKADQGPLVQSELQAQTREAINGIHTEAIRVVFRDQGEIVVLVPAERVGDPRSPISVQRNVLCLWSASYQNAQTITISQRGQTRTIHIPAGYSGWGGTCGGLDVLRTTGLQTGTSPDPTTGILFTGRPDHIANRRITLVPDGVARVKVRLRGGRFVTLPVHDNVYQHVVQGIQPGWGTTWYDTAGQQIDHRKQP